MASSRNIPCQTNECAAWFAGRTPNGWFEGPIEVRVDRDEIVVIGLLPAPSNVPSGGSSTRSGDVDSGGSGAGGADSERVDSERVDSESAGNDGVGSGGPDSGGASSGGAAAPADRTDMGEVAAIARISGFREETRMERMKIAESGQVHWQRHVSWGVRCGDYEMIFTNASIPVMTRLRFDDRQILDTLIDSGVARSRSEAMAWCVSQVGQHQGEWIDRLRDAMSEVERIRADGP